MYFKLLGSRSSLYYFIDLWVGDVMVLYRVFPPILI